MTYGIIFYEITSKNKYVFLHRNQYEIYQDILTSNPININVLYYIKIGEFNHIIYLLDKNKYNDLYKIYENKLEKINYNIFNNKIFHKNIKHKRIKDAIIKKELDLIFLNYKLRNSLHNNIISNQL
jgi:hypothetical protein